MHLLYLSLISHRRGSSLSQPLSQGLGRPNAAAMEHEHASDTSIISIMEARSVLAAIQGATHLRAVYAVCWLGPYCTASDTRTREAKKDDFRTKELQERAKSGAKYPRPTDIPAQLSADRCQTHPLNRREGHTQAQRQRNGSQEKITQRSGA